ncbi:sensor histidine kinase [Dactylosporangium sp. NPDC050588]|uniref:sensor histidine kinase n=1 Tax=Dactylosporangium sp. NPDC050588 TaxID=3157211 RepID=UPI0033DFD835
MRTRLPTIAGGLFVLLALASTVISIVLEAAIGAERRATDGIEAGWISGLAGLALAVPGALLARKVPRNAVAWILCVTGLHWSSDGTFASWVAYATAHDPWLPGVTISWWLYQRLGAALLFSLPLLLIFYPDGRPPEGRWRWASFVSLGFTAVLPVTLLFVPTRIAEAQGGGGDPSSDLKLSIDLLTLPLPDSVWVVLLRLGYAALPLSLLVPFAVVFRRYRQAKGLAKTRMRWLVWAGVVDVLVMLSALLLPQSALSLGLFVAIIVTGGAITVGILRPRLVDIDRLLGGTVLYGALATLVVAVDAILLAAATTLLGEQGAALAGLLVVMLVYGPLRHRLWQLVQRVVLGRRHDPYRVVSGLAEQLERTDSPEDQLLAVARSVAEAFNAPYVAVEVHRGGDSTLLAEHGQPVPDCSTLPITYRGETVGRLILPAGGPRTDLSPRDERLLADVVRQAAAAARSSHLAAELQLSRERLVGAREEERRRVRRDLHDGLGPALGGVALRIDTARNLLKSSPARADDILRQAREDVSTALADVRRLVHDLRPPALDDVGLIGAVDQVADRLRTPALAIRVAGALPSGLPAAVEVAAYRIASEALTNVSKHARASSVSADFSVASDTLVVTVTDDGAGIAAGTPSGVGLISLRERASELGGNCEIECPPDGGTTVRATLPLGSSRQEVADGR